MAAQRTTEARPEPQRISACTAPRHLYETGRGVCVCVWGGGGREGGGGVGGGGGGGDRPARSTTAPTLPSTPVVSSSVPTVDQH